MKNMYPISLHAAPLRSKQRGVGIIEVMVALIVISFGVLGMAGLQLTGMKHSTNGFNRTKAVMLAENMTTRMRINRSAVADQLYDDFDSSEEVCTTKPTPYCQANGDDNAQSCNAQQLADFDMFSVACGEWYKAGASGGVAQLLPAGASMQIVCDDNDCTAQSSYTLSVTWPENENASSDTASKVAVDDPEPSSRVQMRLRP